MDFQENMAFNDLSLFKNQDHLNDKGTTVLDQSLPLHSSEHPTSQE